jgi:hypothetical protein
MRESALSWHGRFWNRSGDAAAEPQFDQYAAQARPQAVSDTRQPGTGAASGRTSPNSTGGNQPGPGADAGSAAGADAAGAQTDSGAARARHRSRAPRTGDTNIRVTLGRPESLPTLRDPNGSSGAVLASAASTTWQRGGEPSAETRTRARVRTAATRTDDPGSDPLEPAAPAADPDRAPSRPAPPAREQDDTLRKVVLEARERLESLATYQVDITRVERVGSQLQSEEDVVLSIRRKPKSVRLEWKKGMSKGREVIYASAINDRMMYVNMGNSSLPLPRMSIPVDSPMALRNSRHPITEAGFDAIIANLVANLDPSSPSARSQGIMVYKGIEKPRGLDQPCHLIERRSPKGETWQVYLSARTLMPVLVSAVQSQNGEIIERYSYQNLRVNPAELASADAFDPDRRWGEPKGLLSRLARAATAPADSAPRQTTTR